MVRADRRYEYSTSHLNIVRQEYFHILLGPASRCPPTIANQRSQLPTLEKICKSFPCKLRSVATPQDEHVKGMTAGAWRAPTAS
eukprot:1619104-Pleurochrysis_carterae.AAC.2